MTCPACGTNMADAERCGVEVRLCPACGACWCARDVVQAMIDAVERRFDTKTLESLRQECAERHRTGLAKGPPTTIEYLKCPDCGTQMNRKAFAPQTGIVADACVPHGLFLEQGQLEAMRDFVARGGELLVLDATNRQLTDALADLGRKVKHLDQARAQAASMFFVT